MTIAVACQSFESHGNKDEMIFFVYHSQLDYTKGDSYHFGYKKLPISFSDSFYGESIKTTLDLFHLRYPTKTVLAMRAMAGKPNPIKITI